MPCIFLQPLAAL